MQDRPFNWCGFFRNGIRTSIGYGMGTMLGAAGYALQAPADVSQNEDFSGIFCTDTAGGLIGGGVFQEEEAYEESVGRTAAMVLLTSMHLCFVYAGYDDYSAYRLCSLMSCLMCYGAEKIAERMMPEPPPARRELR